MALRSIAIPDVGNETLDVIEISIAENDEIKKEQTLFVLESEKTTLEIPAPYSGKLKKLSIKMGDSVRSGQIIGEMETQEEEVAIEKNLFQPLQDRIQSGSLEKKPLLTQSLFLDSVLERPKEIDRGVFQSAIQVHAGPAVRRLAYELGVDLAQVKSTGPHDRILKEDVHAYVKARLTAPLPSSSLPNLPDIDFTQWGSIEAVPLSTLAKTSAKNLQRSWSVIPHVTQFETVDMTELESLRKKLNAESKEGAAKLTVLAFIIKAVALTLENFPKFKASLNPAQDQLILKNYCHIGFAADTPHGLVVPVLRDVLNQSLQDIAEGLQNLSAKARAKKLLPQEMQGACFTISSLGGLGGTQFTPIVNWPEVAILGVSRSQYQPIWDGQQFVPRLMLPLSLSYDHRVIDGADGVRFVVALKAVLESDLIKSF